MSDDIVTRLRDMAYVIEATQGKAEFVMTSGAMLEEAAAEIERLRALNGQLGSALEQMACQNCDDRKCMDCVCRSPHDVCVDDCTECTPRERVHNPFVARHLQRAKALEAWRSTGV